MGVRHSPVKEPEPLKHPEALVKGHLEQCKGLRDAGPKAGDTVGQSHKLNFPHVLVPVRDSRYTICAAERSRARSQAKLTKNHLSGENRITAEVKKDTGPWEGGSGQRTQVPSAHGHY